MERPSPAHTHALGQGFLAHGAVRFRLRAAALRAADPGAAPSFPSAPSVPPLPRPRPFRPAALRGADPGPFRQVANVVFAKYNCTCVMKDTEL